MCILMQQGVKWSEIAENLSPSVDHIHLHLPIDNKWADYDEREFLIYKHRRHDLDSFILDLHSPVLESSFIV